MVAKGEPQPGSPEDLYDYSLRIIGMTTKELFSDYQAMEMAQWSPSNYGEEYVKETRLKINLIFKEIEERDRKDYLNGTGLFKRTKK